MCALGVSVAKAARLRCLIDKIDLLFANEGEALALVEGAVSVEDALAQLHTEGLPSAVISAGGGPVWLMHEGSITRQPVVPPERIRDVTGAGDALAALTLLKWASGEPLDRAVKTGIAAALSILEIDGPYRSDIAKVLGVDKTTGV